MSETAKRLEERGVILPKPPAPAANYAVVEAVFESKP
jgi:hypothetical protein